MSYVIQRKYYRPIGINYKWVMLACGHVPHRKCCLTDKAAGDTRCRADIRPIGKSADKPFGLSEACPDGNVNVKNID